MRWKAHLPQIFVWCGVLCAVALVSYPLTAPYFRSSQLRGDLLTALDNAATVRVVEHSTTEDRVNLPPDYKNRTYVSVILKPDQIADLRRCFWLAADVKSTWILKCTFNDHHYIEMVSKDGNVRTLRICFGCGQFLVGAKPDDAWEYGQLGVMPDYWKASLRDFVTSLGMHPDGPWRPGPP